jgi:hypothetical protein
MARIWRLVGSKGRRVEQRPLSAGFGREETRLGVGTLLDCAAGVTPTRKDRLKFMEADVDIRARSTHAFAGAFTHTNV